MRHTYLNPFVTVQKDGADRLIAITAEDNKIMRVYDPSHPFYGVNDKKELDRNLPSLSEKDFDDLLNNNFISFTPFDQNAMSDEIYQQKNSEQHFSVTLFPTLNCNNACVYCYQKHQNQPRMMESDYETVYNLILNKIRHGVTSINVSLMGGEPTLENKSVLPFIKRCRKTCADVDVAFSGSMTTNGRIMNAEQYVTSGITSFQITMDGPAELHDRLRPGFNGEKTFETILAGLISLRDNGGKNFNCSIRINHTRESIKNDVLHTYLALLAKYFKKDQRFEVFHRIASDLGGDIDSSVLLPGNERQSVLEYVNNKTLSYGLFTKNDMCLPNGSVCYASQNNSITVLPQGKLLKCTVAIDENFNHVGTLSAQGIMLLNDNFNLWTSDNVKDSRCDSCDVAPICQSRSCPLERIRKGKNPCPNVKYDKSFLIRNQIRENI